MIKQFKLLLTDNLDEPTLTILQRHCEVDIQLDLDREQIISILAPYHGLIVSGNQYVSASMIEAGENLRVIGCTVSHLDRIDVTAARDFGVDVITTQAGNAIAVAEQILMWILRTSSGMLSGKTLGLVGYGRTAQQVARRARAFNMRVLVNQPRLTPELALEDIEPRDLNVLLEESDVISLHLHAHSEPLIGSAEIANMKQGATLINFSDANLIDLTAAIESDNLGQVVTINRREIDTPDHIHLVRRPQSSAGGTFEPLARRIVDQLRVKRPSETLSLDIVPIEQVMPHEEFDQKRVDKLKTSLNGEGVLKNPPLVTPWAGKYVVLDGATRTNALRQLEYPHIAVQLVHPDSNFTLHTWYHVISKKAGSAEKLYETLSTIDNIELRPMENDEWTTAFDSPNVICYFMAKDESLMLCSVINLDCKPETMNDVVNAYTVWGDVERTLLTDPQRLIGQFPEMTALAIFPQFKPEEVFDVAKHERLLPAGLTRFVIPGRVLQLNVEMARLKSADSLSSKRAWLNNYLAEKLARSHIRYYDEPVILIDG
ncbi:MAG: NAD(P)-dependent oxidoreductase [Candidatus Promineifilaceae bacterium]